MEFAWSVKGKRSSSSRKKSQFSRSSSARDLPTREKEVIVYHRRSVEERESTKERNRIAMMEKEAVAGLEELEQEVTAGLMLCRIKKKLQSFVKKLKKSIHGKSSKI
jgi:DNA polymerase II small subunit/DNA polymerase delta subunit B